MVADALSSAGGGAGVGGAAESVTAARCVAAGAGAGRGAAFLDDRRDEFIPRHPFDCALIIADDISSRMERLSQRGLIRECHAIDIEVNNRTDCLLFRHLAIPRLSYV